MVQKVWVLQTIPNVKVSSYDENIIYIDFSILKILQSQLRRVWINVNQEIRQSIIEKGNAGDRDTFYRQRDIRWLFKHLIISISIDPFTTPALS